MNMTVTVQYNDLCLVHGAPTEVYTEVEMPNMVLHTITIQAPVVTYSRDHNVPRSPEQCG